MLSWGKKNNNDINNNIPIKKKKLLKTKGELGPLIPPTESTTQFPTPHPTHQAGVRFVTGLLHNLFLIFERSRLKTVRFLNIS